MSASSDPLGRLAEPACGVEAIGKVGIIPGEPVLPYAILAPRHLWTLSTSKIVGREWGTVLYCTESIFC